MNLPEHCVSKDGYPTEDFLSWIESYSNKNASNPMDLVEAIRDCWWNGESGVDISETEDGYTRVVMHTFGWSGNEDIIRSLQGTYFWYKFWVSLTRGGHYTFQFKQQ